MIGAREAIDLLKFMVVGVNGIMVNDLWETRATITVDPTIPGESTVRYMLQQLLLWMMRQDPRPFRHVYFNEPHGGKPFAQIDFHDESRESHFIGFYTSP